MSLLPTDVHQALSQLLNGLASADNNIRSEAEKSLETEWTLKQNVEMLLLFLAENASTPGNETLQAFSAVLFRRIAIKSPKDFSSVTDRTIGVISEPVRAQIRKLLLNGFTSNQTNQVRHKLSDAISEVAKDDVSPPGSWDELIPALFQATTNNDPSFRESAFRVFSSAPELIDKSYINQVLPIFKAGFEDSNDDVRIAACTAFVAFFRDIPKSNWNTLAPLLPDLLNSLPRFLQNGQEQALASVLESLIDLVELAPKMFKSMFPTIIEFCSAVSKNKEVESNARMAALELLTTFSEVAPVMCKLTPNYTSEVILITLVMLTEVCIDDDDAAEWNNKDDNDDEDEEPEYDAARQALDRVSLKLTGKSLAQPLFQYLPDMLQSSQWRERQAALMALSSAAEGCADVLISEIPKILDLILPSLQDNHPRVQYACCNALGQMSTDFADHIQITAGSKILPGLISMLTNKSVPRVQAHAAAALVNFSEAASKEILEPYLDDLLNNLLGLLQSQKRYVQEQVLTTIAIIADAAEKTFVKYYDTLMPLLIEVLKTDMGQESRLLKAKCIECSTLIALAVGKEKFEPHCKELIQLFGVIQESSQSDDDPVIQYLEQGWGRICRIIGKDFLPYLPAVLPPVLSAAKATQDISLLEEEEAEEFNNNEEWDVINLSGKLIAVHTAALDEKVSALDLLRTYAIQLKGDFYPFVKEIVQDIGLSALDFYLHDGVRASAALTLAALLKCSVYATGNNSEESLGLWSQISNKFIDVLTNEPVPELLVAYYTAFVEAISVLGPNCLSPEQLQNLAIAINTNLTDIFEHIKDRDNEDDEYTEEVDDNDNDYSDEELLDEINKAISSIFKNTKANFLPAFQSLIPTIASFINDENINVKLCGLCVICDLLEHAGSEFAYKEMFTDVVAESLVSPEASIRQAAAYSVGVAAQYGGSNYADYCLACLRPLFEIAVIPEARSEDNITATENVVTAIAKICRSYGASVPNLDSIVQEWVTLLPIIQDEEAAPFSYSFLAELIQNQHVAVTSQIPKVVESVLQALAHAAIGGTTAEKVVTATKQLLGALPQEEAVALLQKNPAYIDVAQKWFS
ncbi:ARM repeat-containing protein [Hyphopichia burtonii NRRL Y-1933]|uniref:ARM repeat-containing protein n=1 Tax=Hyphopichia burtonii NRRL Y-1933 TaxID=984485 RepID=A0A1E4REW3_9ASCO|nr:ARM repeat-containing protein [Hyphopichia burtonii NRRL Y-1933]ODV65655.1 ARM repeat-containing protein [Hyphopichia burtonii NRRL Y-1933]